MGENINILSLQAKDICDKDLEIKSLKRYKVAFDYSLESIKLEEVHRRVFRNNKFTFMNKGKIYSNDIISVSFDYRSEQYSTKQLREKLYNVGFYCNGNHYVRYKRSSGSGRVGKCLFIIEELFKPMINWSWMGLSFSADKELDLASKEAYIALTTSSIIDTLEIQPENILLIDDWESIFDDDVISVEVNDADRLIAIEKKSKISNSIWDGQSLADVSLFGEKYSDKGMLLLRNRFFKSCCFNTNIQEFFEDNNITNVSQLNGKTIAEDISQIKLITTPSSIKYLKFGTYENWLKNLEPTFGVVKYDKPPHYFEGELTQVHYQLLNTLEMTKEDVEEFLQESYDYIKLLKTDIPTFRYQLKMKTDDGDEIGKLSTTNDFIYAMLSINDNIKNTSMFTTFRRDLISAYVKNMRAGHILVNGNYSVIMGNGYEMLLRAIGEFNGKSILNNNEIVSKRFDCDKDILAIRSPHVTMGNIWVTHNVHRDEYDKYFNLSKQIMVINAIKNNVQQRCNGCDYDSDALLITDNEILLRKAKENYDKFLVPTSNVKALKTKRTDSSWHKYDLDEKTSVNKIGEIINLSQCLNSLLWEKKKLSKDYSDVYKDICILAVMSGIEIDKAKKEFVVNSTLEIKDMKKKYGKEISQRPIFFRHIPNKFAPSRDKSKYREYETTMDYLETSITKNIRKIHYPNENKIEIRELLNNPDLVIERKDKVKAVRILKEFEIYKNQCDLLWSEANTSKQEKYFKSIEMQKAFIENISKRNLSETCVACIIMKCQSSIQRKMLFVLYQTSREALTELMKSLTESKEIIQPCENGDILIYGKPYKKLQF